MRRVLGSLFIVLLVGSRPLPAAAGQDDERLDYLFAQLKTTDDEVKAHVIEQMIWRIWIENGDPAVDQAMTDGIAAMASGDYPAALADFDTVVKLAPGFAEGWNKRATVYYLMKNYAASVADVERTLALEPRHFGALSGLGLIYLALGDDAAALKAFEAALAIHPHMSGVRERVRALRILVRGRAI